MEESIIYPPRTSSKGNPFNQKQLRALHLVSEGVTLTIQGTAGSGKTEVTVDCVADCLVTVPHIYLGSTHKYFPEDAPAVVVVAYTNSALNNAKNRAKEEDRKHYMTIHKLLEYTLVEGVKVGENGELIPTSRFEPQRNEENPLTGLKVVFIDESTLPNMELYYHLSQALPPECQIIFIGDLNQQRPPFGRSVLEYQATRIESVLLTETYRQKAESPVLKLLHDLVEGKVVNASPEGFKKKYEDSNESGALHINYFSKKLPYEAINFLWDTKDVATSFIEKYNWSQYGDIILIPYNKQFGTTLINKHINAYWSLKNQKETHEVVSGYEYKYFAEGDSVLHENRPCIVTSVEPLHSHEGRVYKEAEIGMERGRPTSEGIEIDLDELEKNPFLEAQKDDSFVQRSVSHTINLYDTELDLEYSLSSQGAISKLIGAHCITSYKAQGRQWDKVFIFHHNSHKSLDREMMFTMLSRTEREVYLQIEPTTFTITKNRQSIKGNSIPEKLDWLHDNPVEEWIPPEDDDDLETWV